MADPAQLKRELLVAQLTGKATATLWNYLPRSAKTHIRPDM